MATDIVSTLQDQLAAHKGEMVLVVSRKYRFHGCTGFGYEPQLREYALDTDFELGIIAELGIETAPDCISVHTTGNHFYWSNWSKKWIESKGEIFIFDQLLSDLQVPLYAPDTERARQQRDEERYEFADADYALEIIIGNCEVEKYLQDRTYMEMTRPPKFDNFEGLRAFDRERNRRRLPPAMLAETLEVSGIAEKRRIVAQGLLKEQEEILGRLLDLEMLKRHAGMFMTVEGAKDLSEEQRKLAVQAVGKKVHTLGLLEMNEYLYPGESTRGLDTRGVKIVVDPSNFIATLAKRYNIPIPEANS